MDIIWELRETDRDSRALFHGINDAPFAVPMETSAESIVTFGIRFYFWSVHMFADDHLQNVLNAHVDVEAYFGTFKKELGERLARAGGMPERIAAAEAYLLRRLEQKSRTNDNVMNAVCAILNAKGVITAENVHSGLALSKRQLERLFREYIGTSPKKAADLVRFQYVWQEVYRRGRSSKGLQDVVHAYSFSDQSHFNNNFKKYAGRSPLKALAAAGR